MFLISLGLLLFLFVGILGIVSIDRRLRTMGEAQRQDVAPTTILGESPPPKTQIRRALVIFLVLTVIGSGIWFALPALNKRANQILGVPPVLPEKRQQLSPPATEFVTLTQAVDVAVPYGTVRLNAGTRLRVVRRQGADVVLLYEGQTVQVPASWTR